MNDFPTRNVFPHTAAINAQGHLVLGGCDVSDLVQEYGTPLYVYDEEALRGVCRQYREEFGSRYADTRVIYAAKAFINVALAGLLREEGLGLDVASGGELAVGLAGGMPAAEVYFHGNNKGRDELAAAVRGGIGRIV
ncbi:MAG: diaminopimelate decarboxylase, partial [Chloroflexi bacterium]|nr:diaminopimelate decarboxylase [Chloroflexota bacterium]